MNQPMLEVLSITENNGYGYEVKARDDMSQTGRVVARWHDEHHDGAFPTCQESLCLAVKRVEGEG